MANDQIPSVDSGHGNQESPGHSYQVLESVVFHGLDMGRANYLAQSLTVREFSVGETLFDRGDRHESLYILESGLVKVGRFLPDGRIVLFDILSPPDLIGEQSVFDRRPRGCSAIAITDVR